MEGLSVQINGELSKIIEVTSSVAQGSHLGPLLFSLFINDVRGVLDVQFCLYADDLKLYSRIDSLSEAIALQQNLESFSNYCSANKLQLNVKKCATLSFTRKTSSKINFFYNINGTALMKVTEMKDLGITFDTKITFNSHINELYSNCLRLVGFILRTTVDFRDPASTLSIFNALIRSRMEYASCIWNPHQLNHSLLLEKIQKKIVRALFFRKLIPNSPEEFNYQQCCLALNINSLAKRRKLNDIKLVLQSFSNQVDTETFIQNFNISVPSRTVRNFQLFIPSRAKTDLGKFSVFNRAITAFNDFCFDIDLFDDNINFKSLLRNASNKLDERFTF
jgi:hypothetical protein